MKPNYFILIGHLKTKVLELDIPPLNPPPDPLLDLPPDPFWICLLTIWIRLLTPSGWMRSSNFIILACIYMHIRIWWR